MQVGATEEEIRSTYRVLVKVWHPDRFQHDPALKAKADEKLKAINAAYLFLVSNPASEEQHDNPTASNVPGGDQPSPVQPQPAHVDRLGWISLLHKFSIPSFVIKCVLAAAFVAICWVLFMPIDKFLASDRLTAGPYAQYKIEVHQGFLNLGSAISGEIGEVWHRLLPRRGLPSVPAAPQQVPGDTAAHKTIRPQLSVGPAKAGGILPYVTAGLSKSEVIAVQGAPTSSSESELTYGSSELYFTGGRLVGWKIDPASSHIRVKLWPDAAVDPDLDSFWVGSSKNDVLAVQGTPNLWSENTFGYGGSEVYFKEGRVVSWKNDPTTVPLRAMRR